jgi:fatty-acyl-CoA synthase
MRRLVIADDLVAAEAAPLLAHLRKRLAAYKVPARIFLVDAFPVTESANGVKVQRGRLRAMAMERIAAEW